MEIIKNFTVLYEKPKNVEQASGISCQQTVCNNGTLNVEPILPGACVMLCNPRISTYFFQTPWTPLSTQVFSVQNLDFLKCKLSELKCLCLDDDALIESLLEEYDRIVWHPTFAVSSSIAAKAVDASKIQETCAAVGSSCTVRGGCAVENGCSATATATATKISTAQTDPKYIFEVLSLVNTTFLKKQQAYNNQNCCQQTLFKKYFCNRTTNGSLLVFPYPSSQTENFNSKNTRGFSFEQLALRKNDLSIQAASNLNRGLTSPDNRFLCDYRSKVL